MDGFDDWYSRLWEGGIWVVLWTQRRCWCCVVTFINFIVHLTFCKLPINRVVKILTSNWIVQSLRRYVYVSFITYWLLGMRSVFIPQQRIGRDDPANLPYLLFVTKYDNVSSGDKSRSSVLVPVGPYNYSFFSFAVSLFLWHESLYIWKGASSATFWRSLTVNV